MTRAAVLGSPIAHSLSPVLHRAAYAALGLTAWTYEAVDMTPDRLPAFLDGLDSSWAGLSLTMPLKATVIPLLDEVSPLARTVGAVNTVVVRPSTRPAPVATGPAAPRAGPAPSLARAVRLVGDNTDVPGLAAVLATHGVTAPRHPVVLGAGSTAASALAALASLGVSVARVFARRPGAAADALAPVAERLGLHLEVAPWPDDSPEGGVLRTALVDADVVIATTPAGTTDAVAAQLAESARSGHLPPPSSLLVDVVYSPWPTRLADVWASAGAPVAGGLELLVQQAARQVPMFTGMDVDPDELVPTLLQAGLSALASTSTGSSE